jgi:hypothetical protein
MITIVVAGRNDDYGGNFAQRLLRTAEHNSSLLSAAGIQFEYFLAEWNPVPDRPWLSKEFVRRIPNARAIVVPEEIHLEYTLNPWMPFHEMAAKNAALRRASGEHVIVTNADILFSAGIIRRIAAGGWSPDTLYRAHRVDVDPSLPVEAMSDSDNQLRSGEGVLPPPYYLGAGGDFCLAANTLWKKLRGFNERVRFSTRAKDWQFFLSASLVGHLIEFIGDVYHLDHREGFRNTPLDKIANGETHFGGWWDIEFGLPFFNPDNWGFADLRCTPGDQDKRIAILDRLAYSVPPQQDRLDRDLKNWLSMPASSVDTTSAILLHSICAADRERRRLVCRLHDLRNLVSLAGMESVARRFSVEIFCSSTWPDMDGFTLGEFAREPRELDPRDWVLRDDGGGLELTQAGEDCIPAILPRNRPVLKPAFNPVLSRRLLRACLRMQREGVRRIAVYGGGRHTEELLQWGLPDQIALVGIVTSDGTSLRPWDVPVVCLQNASMLEIDALLLSSSSFEPEMIWAAERAGLQRVIPLYSDWP